MKKILLILLMAPAFICSAYAQSIPEEATYIFEVNRLEDGLSEEEKEISGNLSLDGSYDVGGAAGRLWKSFLSRLVNELKANLECGTALIGIALICTFGEAVCEGSSISGYIELIGACAAAALLIGGVDSIVSQTVEAMYRLSDYSKAALPVVFSAAAAGGAISSAGAKFAAVSFALDVLMSISQKLIIPTVYAFLALTVSNGAFPNPLLAGMARFTKWAATILMTGMTITFTAYIKLTGVMSAAVDASAVKTAKTIISNTLPVVGGMISDASAMVLSAAGLIRNCAGVFGLVSVCALCIGPFAMLSVKMMVVKAASVVAESLECSNLSNLLGGISSAMGLLMGLLGCCGIMLFISLTAGMKAVTGI